MTCYHVYRYVQYLRTMTHNLADDDDDDDLDVNVLLVIRIFICT